MSKTIEELASEYYINEVINGDTCDDKEGWTDCFVSGAEALMQLPLASRLTAEEKERVKVIYNEELGMAQHFHKKAKASNDISCRQHYYGLREPYISRMKLLERIFGKDFFKEEE